MAKRNPLTLAISEEEYITSMEGFLNIFKKVIDWLKSIVKRIKESFLTAEELTKRRIDNINSKVDEIIELEKTLKQLDVKPTPNNPVEIRLNGKIHKVKHPAKESFYIPMQYSWMFGNDKKTDKNVLTKLNSMKMTILKLEDDFIKNIYKVTDTINGIVNLQRWEGVNEYDIRHPDKLTVNTQSLQKQVDIENVWSESVNIRGKNRPLIYSLVPTLASKTKSFDGDVAITDLNEFMSNVQHFMRSINKDTGFHAKAINLMVDQVDDLSDSFKRFDHESEQFIEIGLSKLFQQYSDIFNAQLRSLFNLVNGYVELIALVDKIINEIYVPISK